MAQVTIMGNTCRGYQHGLDWGSKARGVSCLEWSSFQVDRGEEGAAGLGDNVKGFVLLM